MGTRRLWITLLLFTLPYAVQAATSTCGPTKKPSDCSKLHSSVLCTVPNDIDPPCAAGSELYLDVGSTGAWKKLTQITCKEPSWEAVDDAGNPHTLTAADNVVCAKTSLSCASKDPLPPHDCTNILNIGCDKIDMTTGVPECTPSKFIHVLANNNWEKAALSCDETTGKWSYTSNAAPSVVLASTPVICADNALSVCSQPKPVDCTKLDPSVGCEKPDLDTLKCPATKILLYKLNGGKWRQSTDFACASRNWNNGQTSLSANDEIMCAAMNPDECADLPTMCGTESGCTEPLVYSDSPCATGHKLYFKDGTPNMKWMKVQKIECVNFKWEISYNFGLEPNIDQDVTHVEKAEFDITSYKVICMLADTVDEGKCAYVAKDTIDRKMYKVEEDEGQKPDATAGEPGKCKNPSYNIYTQDGDLMASSSMIKTRNRPVCHADGIWRINGNQPKTSPSISCRIAKCHLCNPLLEIQPNDRPQSMNAQTTLKSIDPLGTCSTIKCDNGNKFVMKMGVKMRYSSDQIICNEDGTGWEDNSKNKNKISEAACVQKLFCYDPKIPMIALTCPSDVPDCEQAKLSNQDVQVPDNELSCSTPKKILMKKNNEEYWDDVNSVKCDVNTAKWEVTYSSFKKEEQLDTPEDYTVVCGSSNPKPRTTTTTTTTTPPPIRPICDICKEILPQEIAGCTQCDTKQISFGATTEDKCTMSGKDKYKIVINAMEEVSALICERTEKRQTDVKWTKTDNTPVAKFSARSEQKRDQWKPLSYVIVGLVFVAIGGMGIGCVVIYMRMRKKLSERETKKKERGVTRKYTSANVVKTLRSAKSSAGASKENGKSKELTKSNIEDNNEDAPTLKL